MGLSVGLRNVAVETTNAGKGRGPLQTWTPTQHVESKGARSWDPQK